MTRAEAITLATISIYNRILERSPSSQKHECARWAVEEAINLIITIEDSGVKYGIELLEEDDISSTELNVK